MFDLDPMVNGKIMRDRHQELIQRVQRENLARDVKPAQTQDKRISPLRVILAALINLIPRS